MATFAIAGAISSLKTAGDLAGSFLKIRDIAFVQGKVIELQSVILSAQQSALASQGEQFALLEEKRHLESQIADLEKWEAEKQRYNLKNLGKAAFVYSLKENSQSSEPPHDICANCYQGGRKSILHRFTKRVGLVDTLSCPSCKTEIIVHGSKY